MGRTGQTSAVSLVTTGWSLKTIAIGLPSYEGDMYEEPDLSLDPGDCMPVCPTDLVTPGEFTIEFEDDEAQLDDEADLDFAFVINKRQTLVLTHRVPIGLTNGATETYTNAFVKSINRGELRGGVRRVGTMTVQVAGYPTYAAAS